MWSLCLPQSAQMITIPTTLILGAGASAALNYPVGEELRERILTIIQKNNGLYTDALKAGFSEDSITTFAEDFDSSALPTIDEFLKHRSDHRDIGSFAIAYELIMYEDEANLRRVGHKSWYCRLRRKLGSGIDELLQNGLSVITFN